MVRSLIGIIGGTVIPIKDCWYEGEHPNLYLCARLPRLVLGFICWLRHLGVEPQIPTRTTGQNPSAPSPQPRRVQVQSSESCVRLSTSFNSCSGMRLVC